MSIRRKIQTLFLAVLVAVGVGIASPAYAAGPYVNLYKNTGYGTFIWSGGGTGCFSLVGTSAQNQASSATFHNLAVAGVYYAVDLYDYGDCTHYYMTVNGHNGNDQYLSSLVYYPCYCNDRVSGVRIYRIS